MVQQRNSLIHAIAYEQSLLQIQKKEQFICDIVTNDDRIKQHAALA